MAELYFCESNPIAVSYSVAGGHTGAVGETYGGSVTEQSSTFAAQGSNNCVMRTYQGPTFGIDQTFSGAVNGTTTLYVTDMGPTFGKVFSAT